MRSFSHRLVSTTQLDKLTRLDEKWEDGEYYTDDDIELPKRESTELDFDELIFCDDDEVNSDKQVKKLVEGDINTTVRQLWKDQAGLALQQLFME